MVCCQIISPQLLNLHNVMKQLFLAIGLLVCLNSIGQEIVTGIVYDIEGKPLPGVYVLEEKGGENGTVTNIEGKFSLPCYNPRIVLHISCYKYVPNKVIVDSTYFVAIELEHRDRQYLKRYEGKKFERLLKEISENIKSESYIEDPSGNLIGLELELKDSTTIKTYFKNPKFVKQADKDPLWDWDIILKSRIEMINHFMKPS